jgi:CzcA family heavy metal efflux pump
MRWILELSLKFRLMVVALAAGMLLLGISQLRAMPVDVLPEFDPPYVEVQTEALGLSSEEVEQLVTVPLEQDLLNGVAWIESMRSESVPGLSSIVLTFKPGTDLYRARQMVGERLTQAFALPHVSKPPTMMQPTSSTSRVMLIGLSSKTISPIDLSVLARWTVGPRLMGVPGVSNVAIWGQRDRQLQVQVDPQHLRDRNVSLLQVIETTGNAMWVSSLSWVEASTPGTGGFIETDSQRLGIRHVFPIASADDLAQVPVEGTLFRLGEVATVVEDHQPLIGDAVGADGAALLLVVEKLPGANTLAVTHGVEKALATMQPGLSGVDIDPSIYRPASYIEQGIDNVSRSLLIGYLLAALVLGLSLFAWRPVLIGLVAIPLSLVTGALVLQWRGASINAMTMAGFAIAIGVIIHDAIVGVDSVARRLRQPRPDDAFRSTASIVLDASLTARTPLLYATLIVLLAVLPVFFIGGTTGAFFLPMALSYGLAVLASMLVALVVTPALCLLLTGSAPAKRRESPIARWLQRGYSATLAPTLRAPGLAFIAVGVLVVLGLAGLPFLRQSLMPTFRERDLLVHLDAAPGTSQPEMNRIVARASNELRTVPGVRNVGAHVGRAMLSDKVTHVHSSDLWVSIDQSAPYDATVAAVQQVVNGYPGLGQSVHGYLRERSGTVAPDGTSDITVRVYGENPDILRTAAEGVARAMGDVSGVVDARVMLPVEQPTLNIQVDLAAAQRYGLKPGDVRRAAATLVSGVQVGNLFDAQKVFDVVVWGTPEVRSSVTSVRDLLLDNPTGTPVRLGDVASTRIVPAPSLIQHDAARTYLDIRADVHGRAVDAVARDVEQRIQTVKFPLEYHAEVLADYAERQAARNRLVATVAAAVFGIFLLVQAASGSWRLAALALVVLPSATVGGVLVILATGGLIALGSLIGLLAVFAIATRNTLGLIKHYQQLGDHEARRISPEVIRDGARDHVLPILTTAVATGFVFVPFAVLGDLPGLEVVRPMAGVVLGGLITSTFVSLFVIPALYLRLAPDPESIVVQAPHTPTMQLARADAAD